MADILDADLPVFPFRVNWKDGIRERLSWKTDVLTDYVANEQRRGLRLTPRREFEVTLTVWKQERSFLALWLHRMVGNECLFPLWHDSVRSTQDAAAGQKTIWLVTEGLEFTVGSYALLRGLTALTWERVFIAEVYPDRIVTQDNLVYPWARGTRVEPLVRGEMSAQTRTSLVTSTASETQALFETTRAQYYSEGVDGADQYLGMPVLTQQPNRTESLDVQHEWSFFESDNETGRRYRKSEVDRSLDRQKHAWFLKGRTAKSAFRSLLYRLKGSLKPIWLPTFNEDLVLAQDAGAAANSIYVDAVGFGYTGGPSSGREHIMIQTNTGRIYRKITGTAAAPAGQERLILDAPLPVGLLRQNVRCISWIDTARLENDRIEFNHVNAADGLSTVSSLFKTFRDERTAPVILSYPIPLSAKVNGPCGDDDPLCYTIPDIYEPPAFEGWYYKSVMNMPGNVTLPDTGNMLPGIQGTTGYINSANLTRINDSDGVFVPGVGVAGQWHNSPDRSTVTIYYYPNVGDPLEFFWQMQQLAQNSGKVNTLSFRRWDSPVFTGPRALRKSIYINPGAGDGDIGSTVQNGAGLFPERYYYGLEGT